MKTTTNLLWLLVHAYFYSYTKSRSLLSCVWHNSKELNGSVLICISSWSSHCSKSVISVILNNKLASFSSLWQLIRLCINTLFSFPFDLYRSSKIKKNISILINYSYVFFLPDIVSEFFKTSWVWKTLIISEVFTYDVCLLSSVIIL